MHSIYTMNKIEGGSSAKLAPSRLNYSSENLTHILPEGLNQLTGRIQNLNLDWHLANCMGGAR